MTIKKKPVVFIALALCSFAIATWAIHHYKARHDAEEQYQNSLAERFDEVMEIAFPLFDNFALAMNERADSIDVLAQRSKEDTSRVFTDALGVLWEKYIRTEGGRKGFAMIEEYEYFKMSPLFSVLMNSGEKKKKETEAIQKITRAGTILLEPYLLQYDSLMNASKEARRYISESREVLEPYRSENKDIHAWRNLLMRK